MKAEHLEPFMNAAIEVAEGVIYEKPVKGRMFLRENGFNYDGVAIIVGLIGKLAGQIVLTMSFEDALSIASSMMGEKMAALDGDAKSALQELSNMISGNAMGGISAAGYDCDITPPSLIVGKGMSINFKEGLKIIAIPFSTSTAKFELNLSIVEKPN